jgi:hypothetical protein
MDRSFRIRGVMGRHGIDFVIEVCSGVLTLARHARPPPCHDAVQASPALSECCHHALKLPNKPLLLVNYHMSDILVPATETEHDTCRRPDMNGTGRGEREEQKQTWLWSRCFWPPAEVDSFQRITQGPHWHSGSHRLGTCLPPS